jgi:integrase
LFALKWKDVDFQANQIHVTRSIVQNVIGVCKTESSQKPVPAHDDLVEALREWHRQTPYQSLESWVFASPVNQGRWPYLAQEIMRHHILPVARTLGITKRIGWHTFRHLFDTASIDWRRAEDHARAAASLDNSRDARYLHAGSDNGKAQCAGGSGRASVPRKNARNASSAWLNTITCTYFVPFCAHAKMEHFR